MYTFASNNSIELKIIFTTVVLYKLKITRERFTQALYTGNVGSYSSYDTMIKFAPQTICAQFTMEFDSNSVLHCLSDLHNPLYTYSVKPVLATEAADTFNHAEIENILNLSTKVSNLASKKAPVRCLKRKCEHVQQNEKIFKKYIVDQSNLINEMSVLALKTKHEFPIQFKERERPNFNVDLDKCLVFPQPSDYFFKTRSPILKILRNDLTRKITAFDDETGRLIELRSDQIATLGNDPSEVLRKIREIPLKAGPPTSYIQGRNSHMRRNILARPAENTLRGTMTAHPNLLDTIILPASFAPLLGMSNCKILPADLENVNLEEYAYNVPDGISIEIKRDPVLYLTSHMKISTIIFHQSDTMDVSQLNLEGMHGDIDGDEITVLITNGRDVCIELTLMKDCRFSMYLPFGGTRFEFSQSHAFFMYKKTINEYSDYFEFFRWYTQFQNEERITRFQTQLDEILEKKDSYSFSPDFTMSVLKLCLRMIVKLKGSKAAFEFVTRVTNETHLLSSGKCSKYLKDIRTGQLAQPEIGMVGDDILHHNVKRVVESEAKGSYDSYLDLIERLFKIDKTTKFSPIDNSSLLNIINEEKKKQLLAQKMISSSNDVWAIGYKMNCWETYYRPLTVGYDDYIYYNSIKLVHVDDVFHSTLIITAKEALFILLRGCNELENLNSFARRKIVSHLENRNAHTYVNRFSNFLVGKFQMDARIAVTFCKSLFDFKNFKILRFLDVQTLFERLTVEHAKDIEHVYLVAAPKPLSPIGSILVLKYFGSKQQKGLNAKRVKNECISLSDQDDEQDDDSADALSSFSTESDSEAEHKTIEIETVDDNMSSEKYLTLELNGDRLKFLLLVKPPVDYFSFVKTRIYYIKSRCVLEQIRIYLTTVNKIVNSINSLFNSSGECKISEIYVKVKAAYFYNFLRDNFANDSVVGYFIYQHIQGEKGIEEFFYVGIFVVTSLASKIFSLLDGDGDFTASSAVQSVDNNANSSTNDVNFYNKEPQLLEKSCSVIFFSFRNHFRDERFVKNMTAFYFIKSFGKFTLTPSNYYEHIAVAMYTIYNLIVIVCGQDCSRLGLQSAGNGPLTLITYENAFRAHERSVQQECDKVWTTNDPLISVLLNTCSETTNNSKQFFFVDRL